MLRKRPPTLQQQQSGTSPQARQESRSPQYEKLPHSRRRVKQKNVSFKKFRRNTIFVSSVIAAFIFLHKIFVSVSVPANVLSHNHDDHKPVTVGCYFMPIEIGVSSKINRIKRLPIYDEDRYPSKRQMPWTEESEESQQKLRDSKRYKKLSSVASMDKGCKIRYDWQKQYHPNCNPVHENEFTKFFAESNTGVDENLRLVANGYYRDVWKVPEKDNSREWVACKTLRYKHMYTNRNFDRHRRDALLTEQTSASPFVVDMYAHCVNTMYSEFASEGSLSDIIWPPEGEESKLSMKARVGLALEAAKGLADIQFVDGARDASIAHTDITTSQFLLFNGSLKLNDFNRARFIAFKPKKGTPCPFTVSNNPGKFRSPEEYDYTDETEKVDVYSLGNVFYSLLTEKWPFAEFTDEEAQAKIQNGERPVLGMENSTDPFVQVLKNTIHLSWTHDASERPSSKDLVSYLEKEIDRLNDSK